MLDKFSSLEAPVTQAGLVDLDGSYVFVLGLFLVFFAILHALVIRPMMATHARRHASTDGAREEAEAMDARAGEAATAYEAELDAARQEAVKVRDALKDEGEEAARAHLTAVRDRVSGELASANSRQKATMQRAETELEARANELADTIVARLIGKAGG